MRRTALIGHTGFVGSNLAAQAEFAERFNSKNIEEMRGRAYDLVVCAGVSAVKWWANQHPAEDQAGIARLTDVLATVSAERFVLTSTIDVYPVPNGVDESTPLEGVSNHAYGTHRYALERFVERFPKRHVIRLPGLFGRGLKKNVIFDLLNDNCLDAINPDSVFQYYDLGRIWADVQRVIELELPLVNFATEPVPTRAILEAFFPTKSVGQKPAGVARYDMRTLHGPAFGGTPGYLYGADATLAALGRFVAEARGT